jgi:hypothetical protein
MRTILIDPETQSITEIELTTSINEAIGADVCLTAIAGLDSSVENGWDSLVVNRDDVGSLASGSWSIPSRIPITVRSPGADWSSAPTGKWGVAMCISASTS